MYTDVKISKATQATNILCMSSMLRSTGPNNMQGMWTKTPKNKQPTRHLLLFLDPAAQSCHSCTLLLPLRHVSSVQTQQSGREIAVEPNSKTT